jgi:hypothetical protein
VFSSVATLFFPEARGCPFVGASLGALAALGFLLFPKTSENNYIKSQPQ